MDRGFMTANEQFTHAVRAFREEIAVHTDELERQVSGAPGDDRDSSCPPPRGAVLLMLLPLGLALPIRAHASESATRVQTGHDQGLQSGKCDSRWSVGWV